MRGRLVEEVQICIRKIHVVWSLGKYRPWNDVVRPRYVRKEEIVIALSRSTIWHWAWLHTSLHWGEERGMTHWVKRKEEPDMWSFLMLCKKMDFTFSIARPSIPPICITNRRITHRRPLRRFCEIRKVHNTTHPSFWKGSEAGAETTEQGKIGTSPLAVFVEANSLWCSWSLIPTVVWTWGKDPGQMLQNSNVVVIIFKLYNW
jgi:hypothetical protein